MLLRSWAARLQTNTLQLKPPYRRFSASNRLMNDPEEQTPATLATSSIPRAADDETTNVANKDDQGKVKITKIESSASLNRYLTPTMQSFDLSEKVALVTGAAQGLGLNIAAALAEAGAKAITLVDVKKDHEGLNSKAHALRKTGRIRVHPCADADVTNERVITGIVQETVRRFGSIDIVVNSAGIVDSNIKAENYPLSKFRRLMDINLTGSFIVSRACAQQMITHKTGGSIIFLSSIAGSRVLHPQQQCAYNASKAAVTQLAKSLAAEWAPHGIRINTIAPGYMDTSLNEDPELERQKPHWMRSTPMGRLGRPDELNGLAVFLASEASRFVTGAHIYADGGYAVH